MLRTLTTHSIPCSYTLLSSLASIIPRASLVLLGTAALFSDGSLYSRAGTAAVAMLAKENRIPVVAACETYKFGERVLLDAVTGNELGKLRELSTTSVALVVFKLTYICCDHRRRVVPIGTRRRRHPNTSDPDSPLVRPHTSSAYHGDLFRGRLHSST